jgi:peroxiredoxin Q/BCP
MGVERATFLIDAHGKLRHIWRKVRVRGHVEDVLKVVKALDAK